MKLYIKQNIYYIFLWSILCFTSLANAAQPTDNGFIDPNINNTNNVGFVGPDSSNEETSVKNILNFSYDDMRVVLKGHIKKRVSHEKYVFSDGTGEIIIEIDYKRMPRAQITPKTLLKIYGEVDKDYFPHKIKIDAKHVEIIN
jgi:uncharacterized protein (TIGR00156 family)